MKSLAILWAQYGPYHFARVAALRKSAGSVKVHALELASRTSDYQWNRPAAADLITLYPGAVAEHLSFREVFPRVRRSLAELEVEVCLLPSYAPIQSLAALLAAKSLGIRTVMMNESHAGTARARGLAAWVKRRLARQFDAALVGGSLQKRYFASLGLPEEMIFTGYDAVDNDYFAKRAEEVRSQREEVRRKYHLPEHYFLSLGRFVPKKNLSTLIRAYRKVLDSSRDCRTHLVMVGSGEEERKLRFLCQELGLPTYDKAAGGSEHDLPGVHFYGFRQIEENPVFYALADVFVLPSAWEEWGLVVNEAMSSGLPVVVSETAGCAEDLLATDTHGRLARVDVGIRQNGFVFDPGSSESLARALLALASDPALREVMGQASRVLVENFSCAAFARNALMAARAANGEMVSSQPAFSSAGQPVGAASGLRS